ncbi:Eukaryotic translation initiation factor 3 subunit J-A [Merluccius polli]|uniref:Eukaryotic translation initiation factor 3 subunit J n=1 Tax=Merluccius polli TaxID=89951 RepID=A0AA47MRF8_MERPO|nr:Eukaryotic translation initiation factor 3 subunit J-A [Merluccius polli]
MADWDADDFEEEAPIQKAAVLDKWEGEDEDDDVKDNWDDDEEEEKKVEIKKETKVSEKKKLSEKIKQKEDREKRKKLEELQQKQEDLTPEEQQAEKLRVKELQEAADLELAKDAFGISSTANNVAGIDAMCPSSKEDFTELEKMLKEKIIQFEKSEHYSNFLDSLFQELCISCKCYHLYYNQKLTSHHGLNVVVVPPARCVLSYPFCLTVEIEDLKKISNALTVLLSEKQKQEKQNKAKKKKKGGVAGGGGLKAKMRDDLDYTAFDGGYAQEYDDFM